MEPPAAKMKIFLFAFLAISFFITFASSAIIPKYPHLASRAILNGTVSNGASIASVRNTTRIVNFAASAADNFWYSQMDHGQSPFAPSGYQIYRNVKDYGAVGKQEIT